MRKSSTHKPARKRTGLAVERHPESPPSAETKAENELAEGLEPYRSKRDPVRTNEPFGPERKTSSRATQSGRYVVHLHAAKRTHYDLRLQVGGVLKSFAVPRGPSLDPADKRLAVHTEDHPLEYLDFEAVIPERNYGAGPMIAWDMGSVVYLETTAEQGLERGKVDFELYGFKLKGRFALVHTGNRAARAQGDENQWLLFKKGDAHASVERDILEEEPYSVLSGLRIEELERKADWGRQLERRALELGAGKGDLDTRSLVPMLCATTADCLDDPARYYEIKLDGVRIVADKHGESVALRYRNGRPASTSYPEIARAVATLAPERVVLDGEIVAFDRDGRPNFQRLAPRIHAQRPLDVLPLVSEVPICYLVFDILQLGDRELLKLPLRQRRALLAELVRGKGFVRRLDQFEGQGRRLFDFCRKQRLEGVVAKRMDSPYRPGPQRTEDWVKIKCEREDDFVVIGWLAGKRSRERLGALCIASYAGKTLKFRGRVGSGLDTSTIDVLLSVLESLREKKFPADGKPPEDLKQAHYARPELVVQVRYLGWTEDGRLRAPVFSGVRADVEPEQCRAAPPDELMELDAEPDSTEAPRLIAPKSSEAATPQPSAVRVTNRNKVFWPDEGYTKGNLCDYYAAVAPVMLPFLNGRPVVLVRYPDGIDGKSFYQWNTPAGTPGRFRSLELFDPEDRTHPKKNVFLIDSLDALVYVANLGCIPIHVLASREHSLERCDFLSIDFDIGQRPFREAVLLALSLKELLDELGLAGFAKTSGQKGLHVLVPLGKDIGFDSAKILVELLGRLVTARHADIATMERRVSKRGDRVFVDTGQTGASRTIVAPYSVRAVAGATVSTPLFWQEVHAALDPKRFTMLTVPTRIAELGDPMAGFLETEPDIQAALAKLEEHLR